MHITDSQFQGDAGQLNFCCWNKLAVDEFQ